jgi:hypothetical protein
MVGVKIMKHYKSPTNDVWAYEEDGSQDDIIPKDFIAITQEEADELNHQKLLAEFGEPTPTPSPTKEELMAKLLEIQSQLENLA